MTTRKRAPRKPPADTPAAKRKRRTSQPRYAQAAALRSQVLELRILGQPLAAIADKVGRAVSVVHTHLSHALDELDEQQKGQAAQLRALAYARLERLLRTAMLKAAGGDLRAMREAQRLILAQARIMGFDAPIKHATTDPTGEHERAPPGTWTLPMRQDVPIEDWQAQAEAIWQAQQQRDHALQA